MSGRSSTRPKFSWLRLTLRQARVRWRRLATGWKHFLRHPLGVVGLALIALFALLVLVDPLLRATVWKRAYFDPIVGYDPTVPAHPAPPGGRHLLGTDNFGRDVLSMVLAGTRVSFSVGLLAGLIGITISTFMGGVAGYFGGVLDLVLMGIVDVFVLLPAPVVLLIFGLLVRMEWPMVALTYGALTGLGGQAIVIKAQTLTLKVKPFIEAARIAGGSDGHIIRHHILPGLLPLTIVHAVLTVVGAVLTESLLSFFSRTQYYLSWGMMIWLGQETFRWFNIRGQWHVVLPPALAIMLFCSAFYLVGRALDEILNPRLRRR